MGTNSRRDGRSRGARRKYVQLIAPGPKESIDTILEMAEYKKFGAAKK